MVDKKLRTILPEERPRSINIKFPVKRGKRGAFEVNETTIDAVIDDLKILILTNHGERPIQFDFGANLRPILFEQIGPDLETQVDDSIRVAVEKWMPFVNIQNITVQTALDTPTLLENQVNLIIEFFVGNLRGVLEQRVAA